jgi:uncharacterized protein YndB with AHSA1/START domain
MPHEFEIRNEVELHASPEQVWQAIATEGGLATWFMPMPVAAGDAEAWEPGHRLLIRTPTADDGSTQAFEYLLEAQDGGTTVLRFVHSGFTADDWSEDHEAMTRGGWAMYLATLAQYFLHFTGRSATYVEAEGPAASGAPEAWSSLEHALAPGGRVDVGAEVTIDLGRHGAAGSTPDVVGTIDYRTDRFVGVRTDDALIRFHGRSSIGMPVAVSHHAYAPINQAATTEAWTQWLAAAFAPPS